MLEPFFFNQGKLFGCYHPASDATSMRLLVICPPFFDEYRRTFAALANLANECAAQGIHVLRFNYYGTGESWGQLNEANAAGWCNDVSACVEEGVALTGADTVTLLGVRFGAVLASYCQRPDVKRYLFWDPLISGSAYLDWLKYVDTQFKQEHAGLIRAPANLRKSISYENFTLPSSLQQSIAQLSLQEDACKERAETFCISTNTVDAQQKQHHNIVDTGFKYDWPYYGVGILRPKPVLSTIVEKVLLP